MKNNILIIFLAMFVVTVISICTVDNFSCYEIVVNVTQEETNEKNNEVVNLCHDFITDYNNYYVEDSSQHLSKVVSNEVPIEDGKNTVSETIDKNHVETKKEKVILSKKQLTDENYDTSYMRSCLIHLLYFEACSDKTLEDVKEQRAIISVVINRFNSNIYKGCYDVEDIIFFKYPNGTYAFSPARNKDMFWFRGEWEDSNIYKDFLNNYEQLAEKVDYVLTNGTTVPSDVMYFVSNGCYKTNSHFNNKDNYTVYAVYDDTTFMTSNK